MEQVERIADPPTRRWHIAWLLGFGVLVNYFDRVNLSVSQQALHAEFGISAVTFGFLLSAYSWTYAALQLPSGVLLDRFGVRRVGLISTSIWSIACFLAAFSNGIAVLFASRLLLGVGEAPTFPGNAKAIGHWFPPEQRSFPTAVFDAAAKFASAIGVPAIGLILLAFGWRASFAATGLLSVIYLLLFFIAYRNPPSATATIQKSTRTRESAAPLSYLLARRRVWGLALGFAAYNYSFYLLLTWLPSYLSMAHGLDILHSVLYTSVPWLFATFTDLLVGGWMVDALIRNGSSPARVRQVILVSGTALGLGMFGVAYAHSTAQAIFWITLSLGGLAAAAPIAWSIPSLIAPRGSVGSVGGIMNCAGQVAAIAAPIVTGYVVQATHSFAGAFITAAVFLVVGIAAYTFLLGNMAPIPELHA